MRRTLYPVLKKELKLLIKDFRITICQQAPIWRQIEKGFLRYQHDHVLDEMVHDLGLTTEVENKPFEPEPGAYARHNHSHSKND